MSDPYKILGVPRNATDDEIKAAYRGLAKKYHPDNYANNPLADLAAEKMKEINEAYDTITKERQGGGSGYSQGGYNQGGYNQGGYQGSSSQSEYSGYSNSNYKNVRDLINSGNVAEAQSILDGVPSGRRDAEWFFLKGSIFFKNGWTNEAYTYFYTAVKMEPSNREYQEAMQRLSWQMNNRNSGPFGQNYGGYNGSDTGCNGCDICSSLMCAECLCNGCGGGGGC